MKIAPFQYSTFIFVLLLYLIFPGCNTKMLVKYEGIRFENLKIEKDTDCDSLFLSFSVSYDKKVFGKKALIVIFPKIIKDWDTLDFKSIVQAGCGLDDDCDCVPYTIATQRNYNQIELRSKQNVMIADFESGIFNILITSAYGKKEKKHYVAYKSDMKNFNLKCSD